MCFLFTMSDRTAKRMSALRNCFAITDGSRGLSDRAVWWSQTGSNRRPHACKARALPTELWPRDSASQMVGLGGLEPPTSRLSSARSNQLSYKPELYARRCRKRRLWLVLYGKKEKRRRRRPAKTA